MSKIISFIRSNKVSIGVILGGVLLYILGRNYIQQDTYNLICLILVAAGFGSGVNNVGRSIKASIAAKRAVGK